MNPRDLKVDSEGNYIDYLMLSQSGLSWTPVQEVSLRVTMPPLITGFNESAIMEDDGGKILELQGYGLEPDYSFALEGIDIGCRVLNKTSALCQMPSDFATLLKMKAGPYQLGISYSNPVSMKSTALTSASGLSIGIHSRFTPVVQSITTAKN